MDQLTALKVFRRAAELGSFAAASRDLRLSPAAVSKNIGELEAHVGARLFHRTTRRMSLTEAGSVYYERVRGVLDDLADADRTLGSMQDSPRGRLRVSAPMTLTQTSLSPALPGFLERYPELALDLHLDDRRVNIVEEGFDLALRGSDRLQDSSLVARRLTTLTHVLCASPSYFDRYGEPTSPKDLTAHRCVQFSLSDHANTWTFKKGKRTTEVPVDGPYKVTSSIAVRDALRAGYGISLIPKRYVIEDLRVGRLRTALDAWSCDETRIYAVYPSRRYLVSKVRVFLDFLIEHFREEP